MTLALISRAARACHLDVLGGFHPDPSDTDLKGIGTLLLFGPCEPGFWAAFAAEPEYLDGAPNSMDRWSARILTGLATAFNAHPFFPFTGPPYQPFFQWALRTQRCHQSPVSLLVHDDAGLFVSFRGALALPQKMALPVPAPNPCLTCDKQPCLTSCPVGALSGKAYDVTACRSYLADPAGKKCLSGGCQVRRACPVSQSYGRNEAQSEFHMQAFVTNGP